MSQMKRLLGTLEELSDRTGGEIDLEQPGLVVPLGDGGIHFGPGIAGTWEARVNLGAEPRAVLVDVSSIPNQCDEVDALLPWIARLLAPPRGWGRLELDTRHRGTHHESSQG